MFIAAHAEVTRLVFSTYVEAMDSAVGLVADRTR
jgi:hypothetical protein